MTALVPLEFTASRKGCHGLMRYATRLVPTMSESDVLAYVHMRARILQNCSELDGQEDDTDNSPNILVSEYKICNCFQ
jgi:hypothetical protein